MSNYVVMTVDSVYRHEIHEGEESIFSQPYDIRLIADPDEELASQLNLISAYRAMGTVFCFEVSSYDRDDPSRGWVLEAYDKGGNPYLLIKCIKV